MYTDPPEDIPCIQQRHVVMILGASRQNIWCLRKFPQEKVFTSFKCVVHVTYSQIKDCDSANLMLALQEALT